MKILYGFANIHHLNTKKRKEMSNQSTLGIQMIKSHMRRSTSSIFFKPEPESILFRVIDSLCTISPLLM